MVTKYKVYITLYGQIDSKALYDELKSFNANVTDLFTKTLVYLEVDLTSPIIEYVLQICYKYSINGRLNVDMKQVTD